MSKRTSEPICPNCFYELSGLDADTADRILCPECGKTALPTTFSEIKQQKSKSRSIDLKMIAIILFFLLSPIITVLLSQLLTY